MIKTLIVALAWLTISMAVRSDAAADRPPLLRGFSSVVKIHRPLSPLQIDTPLKYVDKLQVNTDVAFRTAADKDEQAGIADLHELSLNATLEEHWVFLPKENRWIEIGFDETIRSATLDFDFLEDLIVNHDQLAIYHIHPRNYLQMVKERDHLEIPETWLVVPSFPDMALMIYFTSRFRQYHPEGRISWNVCSPLGRTSYALSAEGLEHYGKKQQDAFLLTYFYPGETATVHAHTVSTFDLTAAHAIDDLIQWVNDQGNNYFEIEYFPYAAPDDAPDDTP